MGDTVENKLMYIFQENNVEKWKLIECIKAKYVCGVRFTEPVEEYSINKVYNILFLYRGYLGQTVIRANDISKPLLKKIMSVAFKDALVSKMTINNLDKSPCEPLKDAQTESSVKAFFNEILVDDETLRRKHEKEYSWLMRELRHSEEQLDIKIHTLMRYCEKTHMILKNNFGQEYEQFFEDDYVGCFGCNPEPFFRAFRNMNVNESIYEKIAIEASKAKLKQMVGSIGVIEAKGSVKFSRRAVLSIVQCVIILFYMSFVANGKSPLKIENIGDKLGDASFNLAEGFLNIKGDRARLFDFEGVFLERNYLIKEGMLSGFLSNGEYAHVSNKEIFGNAIFLERENGIGIGHKKIMIDISKKSKNYNMRIEELTCTYNWKRKTIEGTGKGYNDIDGDAYALINVSIELARLLKGVNAYGNSQWVESLYTPELILEI